MARQEEGVPEVRCRMLVGETVWCCYLESGNGGSCSLGHHPALATSEHLSQSSQATLLCYIDDGFIDSGGTVVELRSDSKSVFPSRT